MRFFAQRMGISVKILIYKWKVYYQDIIADTFRNMGHEVYVEDFSGSSYNDDDCFKCVAEEQIRQYSPDMVFTVNYFGVLSDACRECGLPYVAWTCDSPLIAMYHESVFNSNNFLFIFDKVQYYYFKNVVGANVYYLPLAANPDFLPAVCGVCNDGENDFDVQDFNSEISFVGSLYEKNSYDSISDKLTPYLCGYFDAAMNAQADIFGENIFDRLLTPDILAQLGQIIDFRQSDRSFSDIGLVFNTTFLGFKMAQRERIGCLSLLGQSHEVKLYTDSHIPIDGVRNMGSVSYHEDMAKVFENSKINLNFTLRNIRSGIPLRVWDVLACGGFLLTNFQAEMPAFFENGKDLVWFDSIDDMKKKADYYLTHEDERLEIAANGCRKARREHSYENRLSYIIDTVRLGCKEGELPGDEGIYEKCK